MRRSLFLVGVALLMSGCSGVSTEPAVGGGDVTVTEVVPAQGPLAGNIPVQIKGSGFVADNLLVTFGGTAMANPELIDAQTVRGMLPPRSQAGVVDVVVACAAGQFSLANGFEYHDAAPISITGLNPPNGPLTGGTTVTITGTGFQAANATVAFGGVNGTGVSITSDTSLSVLTPASATAGPVSVSVANANGTATLPNAFVYGNGGGGGGGGGSTVTENLGGVVEFNNVKQGGDPAYSQGFGLFFAASDVSYPSPGTCALDLNQFPNVTTTLDAGANVTIAQGSNSMSVPKVSNSYGPSYLLNNGPASSYVLGQMAGVSGPGAGAGIAAFNAASVAAAPSTDYQAWMDPLGFWNFEGGGVWTAGSDMWFSWTGSDTSPVDHVQLFIVGQDLGGATHVLQCDLREGGDMGGFCVGAGGSGDLCQTPGAKMSDFWTAIGGPQMGFGAANVILYRGNRSTFTLPNGSNAALDVSIVKVGSLIMSE